MLCHSTTAHCGAHPTLHCSGAVGAAGKDTVGPHGAGGKPGPQGPRGTTAEHCDRSISAARPGPSFLALQRCIAHVLCSATASLPTLRFRFRFPRAALGSLTTDRPTEPRSSLTSPADSPLSVAAGRRRLPHSSWVWVWVSLAARRPAGSGRPPRQGRRGRAAGPASMLYPLVLPYHCSRVAQCAQCSAGY